MAEDVAVYEVGEYADDFQRGFKRYFKKKRYTHLPGQIKELIAELEKGNFSGVVLRRVDEPIHFEIYKKRLPIPDANKGESGGYRVIYIAEHDHKYIIFADIYTKADKEDVTDAYVEGLAEGMLMRDAEQENED